MVPVGIDSRQRKFLEEKGMESRENGGKGNDTRIFNPRKLEGRSTRMLATGKNNRTRMEAGRFKRF
jgi:hypothetical protein